MSSNPCVVVMLVVPMKVKVECMEGCESRKYDHQEA
jgi:hypothetical protein